jgi:hypothetical protein
MGISAPLRSCLEATVQKWEVVTPPDDTGTVIPLEFGPTE